ncbi:TAH18 [[Candida] subhashii]|uniref:NADPH-dependent diflavin oxidoreductase 1 n=1 Tax=[Candida] subhashii TaxID=561895 RepID=A0A8J5QHB5_9ASCO|nr:TAH18 [[Candida] subhashii]KAG7664686.1 TAH18 [[Candida] subhashii]
MGQGDITILYGSETGNAEEYARYLKHTLGTYRLKSTLSSLDEFPLKKLITDTAFLIIICSTTGQGELPRNAKKFMKFILKRKLPNDLFQHLYLTTFGLGDSSYSKFNYAIKKIHTRMTQLGCQELSPRSEADEVSPEGVDGFYVEWEAQVVQSLLKFFPNTTKLEEASVPMPQFKVTISNHGIETNGDVASQVKFSEDDSINIGTVVENKRITSQDHFQDVRDFKIKSEDLQYLPGDTISLYPCNHDQDVEALLEVQPHWAQIADRPLLIKNAPHIEGGIVKNLTLRTLLKYHLDIMSIPRRSFFALLWHFCDSSTEDGQREQEKLKEFGSFEEPEDLYDYANRPRRSILETILEFQNNLVIPIAYILDLFPLIKPRFFSIASRPSASEVEIIVAIVEYKTIIRRIRRGLCTRWLKSLQPGDEIRFSIQKSSFSYSENKPPIIMVAPGTGIAPMKSVIDEVLHENTEQELYLFFGCRFQEKDHLTESFWQAEYPNLHIFNCFSRDKGYKYKYVQDGLFDQYKLIGKLILEENAKIFVCGSSGKMPQQVKITFSEILKKYNSITIEEAQRYILQMEDNGRYKEDAW